MTLDRRFPSRLKPDFVLRAGAHARARFWVERKGKNLLTHGRVLLLEEIARQGSIRKAARALGMSYRHAWLLMDSMNRLVRKPLVERVTGGRHGGGASLTSQGRDAICGYRRMEAELSRALTRASRHLSFR